MGEQQQEPRVIFTDSAFQCENQRRVHLVRRTGPRIKGSINSFVAPLPTQIEMRLLRSLKMKQRGQSAQPKNTRLLSRGKSTV